MIDSSPRSVKARGIAPLCFVLLVIASCGTVLAAPASSRDPAKAVATSRTDAGAGQSTGERPISWTTGEASARGCQRIRRKLWQDGEGWVVKAVKSCL